MLQSFKDRIRGSRWLGYTIVGIISVPFALWGIQAYVGGGGRTAAAEVNGEEIPARMVERRVAQQRQQLSQRFDGNLPDAFSDQMLRERVLDQMITRALLEQTVRDAGLRISADALAQRIRSQEMFRRDGSFDRELYRSILRQSGMTPSQYEARVRDGGRVEQLRQGVMQTGFVLEAEARERARLEAQQRDVLSLQYGRDAARAAVTVEPDAVQAYYEENREQFQTPEQVRLAWVELDIEALKEQVEVSEEALRREYESAGQRYREAAARKASHILLEVPEDAGEEAEAEVLEQARSLRERLREGADFAELAREHSDDPGSAGQGGDLGFITRDMMVEPFEETLFSLEGEGAVSDPVRTTYGYHLIKLVDVREREQKPFAEVRGQILDELQTQRAENRFHERVEVLKNTAYENPDGLDAVADATGLAVRRSDWIGRDSGEGIGEHAAVREAAFSPTVLDDRRNSDVIELGQRRVAVIRATDHREPEPRPLEAVREDVRERVRSRQIEARLQEWSERAIERLEAGETPADFAGEATELVEHGWIDRRAGTPARQVVETAFAMPPPGGGEGDTRYEATTLGDGSRAVVIVRGLRYPEVEADAVARARQQGSRAQADAEFRAWIEALRAGADIERFERDPDGPGGTGR